MQLIAALRFRHRSIRGFRRQSWRQPNRIRIMRLNSEIGSVADNLPILRRGAKRCCREDVRFTGRSLEAKWFPKSAALLMGWRSASAEEQAIFKADGPRVSRVAGCARAHPAWGRSTPP